MKEGPAQSGCWGRIKEDFREEVMLGLCVKTCAAGSKPVGIPEGGVSQREEGPVGDHSLGRGGGRSLLS